MLEIRPKETIMLEDNEKMQLWKDAGFEVAAKEEVEKMMKVKVVTSADKKIEIAKRLYQTYDPWTFDGDEKDVVVNTILDPFAAIEYLLDTIDSILE